MVPRLLLLPLLSICVSSLPVNSSRSLSETVAYSDAFARHYMLPLSAAAYHPDPAKCLANGLGKGYKLFRYRNVKCDNMKDTCAGFTAVSENDKAMIISFRGTTEFLQIIQEGWKSLFDSKITFEAGGSVDSYFYDAFVSVWRGGMRDDFLSLKQKYPDYELWVTGHSLGGSMATLCASVLQYEGLMDASKMKLVTFGQPRTGDSTYAKIHDQKLPYSYRVTHSHDIVPHVPMEVMLFTHHKSEIWYKAWDMGDGATFVECDADESKSCSDSNWVDASIPDHLIYFDLNIPVWASALKDCQNS